MFYLPLALSNWETEWRRIGGVEGGGHLRVKQAIYCGVHAYWLGVRGGWADLKMLPVGSFRCHCDERLLDNIGDRGGGQRSGLKALKPPEGEIEQEENIPVQANRVCSSKIPSANTQT